MNSMMVFEDTSSGYLKLVSRFKEQGKYTEGLAKILSVCSLFYKSTEGYDVPRYNPLITFYSILNKMPDFDWSLLYDKQPEDILGYSSYLETEEDICVLEKFLKEGKGSFREFYDKCKGITKRAELDFVQKEYFKESSDTQAWLIRSFTVEELEGLLKVTRLGVSLELLRTSFSADYCRKLILWASKVSGDYFSLIYRTWFLLNSTESDLDEVCALEAYNFSPLFFFFDDFHKKTGRSVSEYYTCSKLPQFIEILSDNNSMFFSVDGYFANRQEILDLLEECTPSTSLIVSKEGKTLKVILSNGTVALSHWKPFYLCKEDELCLDRIEPLGAADRFCIETINTINGSADCTLTYLEQSNTIKNTLLNVCLRKDDSYYHSLLKRTDYGLPIWKLLKWYTRYTDGFQGALLRYLSAVLGTGQEWCDYPNPLDENVYLGDQYIGYVQILSNLNKFVALVRSRYNNPRFVLEGNKVFLREV